LRIPSRADNQFWGIRVALQAVFECQRSLDGVVAQDGVRRVDGDVRRVHDRLRLGGVAVERRWMSVSPAVEGIIMRDESFPNFARAGLRPLRLFF
jgi:hypothetical protein